MSLVAYRGVNTRKKVNIKDYNQMDDNQLIDEMRSKNILIKLPYKTKIKYMNSLEQGINLVGKTTKEKNATFLITQIMKESLMKSKKIMRIY